MTTSADRQITLVLECEDRMGIVYAVAGFLVAQGCNIVDSQQFDDERTGTFFLRIQAERTTDATAAQLRGAFEPIADEFGMTWWLDDSATRVRTMILVSHADHCLTELLSLWESGLLNIDVTAIVSNHETLRPIAERHGLAFHHIPVSAADKPAAERALLDLVAATDSELVVLARYMQILSDELCARLPRRVINIHHSFLPGFKGARPYHQAFDRGVKLIGATAHYVTADLDEGPIIEQIVRRVDHRSSPAALAVVGRQAERAALAEAVRLHAERRVLVHGARTIVFN